MKIVEAVRYCGPMRNGAGHQTASNPQLLLGNDGNEYVVKLLRDCSGNRTLANEQVAGAIAGALQVPVPGMAHVFLSADLINKSPELQNLHAVEGSYLGNVRLRLGFDLTKAPPDTLSDKISNPDEASGAMVLDAYVWNTDRNNAGNLLVEPTGAPHKYRLYAIDHGHCFGGNTWTDVSLAALAKKPYTCPTHSLLTQCAARAGEAEAWVDRIEKLQDSRLDDAVDEIPEEWNFPDSSRETLRNYLRERKGYTRRDCRTRGVKCR